MNDAPPELLPAAARVAVPWKNGGGRTREVCASPPGASFEAFDWRISTAEVTRGGPFSSFPGVDRTLCILGGELRLRIAEQAEHRLGRDSLPLLFSGESPVYGEPVGGAVTDLNVMVRRERGTARVSRRSQQEVTGARAAVTVLYALAPIVAGQAGKRYALEPDDALKISAGTELRLSGASAHFYLIELFVSGGPV